MINFLKVSGQFQDNPVDGNGDQIHLYDQNQDGIVEAIGEICRFVHERDGIFMVGEVGSEDMDILRRYSGSGLLDVVFNFNLGSQEQFLPADLYKQIKLMEEQHRRINCRPCSSAAMICRATFPDSARGDAELEEQRAKLMAALMLTAKGSHLSTMATRSG